MKESELQILICSCDAYSDVWQPFFALFFRYWKDCPYKINIIANEKRVENPQVRTIATSAEDDWSSAFLHALSEIGAEYILVLMEDYLLTHTVDTRAVRDLASYAKTHEANCVYLHPLKHVHHTSEEVNGYALGNVKPDMSFRVNLQAAIWNKQVLCSLVQRGESAWEFEVHGSRRSRGTPGEFLSLVCRPNASPLRYYCTGVVRGKWMPGAVRLCRKEGVTVDSTRRRIGWVRGLFRDSVVLQPIRHFFVLCKRICGIK